LITRFKVLENSFECSKFLNITWISRCIMARLKLLSSLFKLSLICLSFSFSCSSYLFSSKVFGILQINVRLQVNCIVYSIICHSSLFILRVHHCFGNCFMTYSSCFSINTCHNCIILIVWVKFSRSIVVSLFGFCSAKLFWCVFCQIGNAHISPIVLILFFIFVCVLHRCWHVLRYME